MANNDFSVNFSPSASPLEDTKKRYGDLNAGFTGFLNSQETVPQLTSRYNDMYGVPQMQNQIQQGNQQYDYLGNQVMNMPKTVAQGSQESIMTQGQKDRVVQSQQAPILQQQGVLGQNLSRMGQNLGTAQTNAGNMINAEQAQQMKMTQPWMQSYNTESVLSTMAMTGWSSQNSMELQRLLANQSAGIQISEGEKNRMNQLAVAENNFEHQLKLQQDSAKNSQQNNLMPVGAGTSIFDPSTGRFIGTAPYKAVGGGGSGYGQPDFSSHNNNTIQNNQNLQGNNMSQKGQAVNSNSIKKTENFKSLKK